VAFLHSSSATSLPPNEEEPNQSLQRNAGKSLFCGSALCSAWLISNVSRRMNCECASLPEYDYYTPGRSLSRKIRPVTKTVAREKWHELLRCEACGTYWRIDVADKQERFAWKAGTFRPDWASPVFPEKEKALLLQRRGGETSEKCVWLGCEKRKVHGVAYCIDHLYATGARK
jgi:hypothetical protein